MRKRAIITLIVAITAAGLIGSCGGTDEELQDTIEVAENFAFILADSASQSISSCSYRFRVYMTGSYSDAPELTGNLTGMISDEMETPLLRIEMKQNPAPDDSISTELSLIMITGTDSSYSYSPDENLLVKGSMEAGGADLLRPARYTLMNEYFLGDPFADEIASRPAVPEGLDTVGTVVCETYLVTYSGGQQARWSLGLEDHIPRRVERLTFDREGNDLSIILEVYDLDLSPEISDAVFTFEPPDGAGVEIYSAFLTVGASAPLFRLNDREGHTVSLENMRGSVVVLDFWATWCNPCIAVMPEIQSLFESYSRDQVRIYGINVWETGDPGLFMDENGFTYGLLLEGDAVAEDYMVSGIPTMYIIDQEGRIAFVEVGANPEIGEMLSSTVDSLLAAE